MSCSCFICQLFGAGGWQMRDPITLCFLLCLLACITCTCFRLCWISLWCCVCLLVWFAVYQGVVRAVLSAASVVAAAQPDIEKEVLEEAGLGDVGDSGLQTVTARFKASSRVVEGGRVQITGVIDGVGQVRWFCKTVYL